MSDTLTIDVLKNDEPEIIEIVSGIGPMPNHQVSEGKVRFEKPDGTWGPWVNVYDLVTDWSVDQEGDHYIHPNNIRDLNEDNIQSLDGGSFI